MNVFAVEIFLILLLLTIVLIAIAIALILRKSRRKEPDISQGRAPVAEPSRHLPAKSLLASFSRGLRFLKGQAAGRDFRYEVPWLLMLGARRCGATTVLANAGASASLAREGGPTFGLHGGPEWWFYERGLVLNAPGDMVLGSGGRSTNEAGWYALLQSLLRRRARRPLDAVILAIGAEDLLDNPNSAAAAAGITGRAEFLRQKLSQLRRTVSMRMPIYVLVTKCDLVPGFTGFASELPPEAQADIFGWSNPYPLDAAFSPDWVDQCCREMQGRILEQQMEIFVERNQLREPDGVFLFPTEFQRLREPLRQYLGQIFQPNAYEESYYFRGIYFCGDPAAPPVVAEWEPLASVPIAAEAGGAPEEVGIVPARPTALMVHESADEDRRPVFLSHLFERKIFPESRLARPLSVLDMSRNRTVLTAKILTALFVLVAGSGTLFAYMRFSSLKRQPLGPLFQQLAEDVNHSDYRKARRGTETPAEKDARIRHAARDTNNVLRSMGILSQTRFRSVFMPGSWNDAVDHDLQGALAKAFGTIVLSGFRVGLEFKLSTLIQATTPDVHASAGDGAAAQADDPPEPVFESVADVPEYKAWAQYIAGLKELEENIGRYNRCAAPGLGSVDDLKELLKYLKLDANLPSDFDFNNPYFAGMLQQATNQQFSFRSEDDQVVDEDDAVNHARELIQGFFAAWFGPGNRLAFDVDQMTDNIGQFPARGSEVSYQPLRDIADSIGGVSADLDSPAFDWVSGGQFDAQQFPAFNQSLAGLHYLQDFKLDDEMTLYGKSGFRKFTADLAMKSTRLTGQVLDTDAAPVQLSSSVEALHANLRVLLDQVFVAREPGVARRLDPARPVWDRNTLLEADKLFDAYDKYERGSLRTAPPSIRAALQRVALGRLQQNVLEYVGEAQSSIAPGSPEGADVQSFSQSLDVLQRLLAGFGKFEDQAAARSFSSLLTGQASRMMLKLYRDLDDKNLYAVRDRNFNWWEGEKPLSLAAYDVRSGDDLKEYVDRERGQVNGLAQQAEPLVKFLQPGSAGSGRQETQALSAWRGISQELKEYSEKMPGNSVLLLEDFIRTGMDKIAPDSSCPDAARDPAGHSDFFLARRDQLRAGAVERCRILSERAYTTEIAALFNQRLAGRFPFSAAAPETPFQEADPGAVAAFFGKFDQFGKIANESLSRNSQLGKSRESALGFLSRVAEIRPVFAAFLVAANKSEAEKNPVPAFDFAVKFRVNRDMEIGGDQIIDWGLDVGEQSFAYRAKENTGHWRLGDPLRISFRFADDSPLVPVIDHGQPAMNVHQRTVTFEYTGAWSLFRLLLDHKPNLAEFDPGAAPLPYTLSFYLPATPDWSLPQRKDGPAAGQVRVYLQITVVPPGAKEGVNVPLPFPAQAPLLGGN